MGLTNSRENTCAFILDNLTNVMPTPDSGYLTDKNEIPTALNVCKIDLEMILLFS